MDAISVSSGLSLKLILDDASRVRRTVKRWYNQKQNMIHILSVIRKQAQWTANWSYAIKFIPLRMSASYATPSNKSAITPTMASGHGESMSEVTLVEWLPKLEAKLKDQLNDGSDSQPEIEDDILLNNSKDDRIDKELQELVSFQMKEEHEPIINIEKSCKLFTVKQEDGSYLALIKKCLLGNVKEGRYSVLSLFYVRKWFAPFLQMVGSKIGKMVEISTVTNIAPDLLQVGDGSFIADSVSIGAAKERLLGTVRTLKANKKHIPLAEKPLWSSYVWRSELITALYENIPVPFLINMCLVFLNTWRISEFDLVEVNDYAAVNVNSALQTHLFEDRVMKMSNLIIQPHCSIGHSSVVLYDTVLEEGSTLCNLSLLMKGEVLPKLTVWEGIPAQFKSDYSKLASLKKKSV
ncbi:hypothetical protein CONCODRAFT_3861 [Conidiobolus coronatus NRRL 28638]|uniref:Uncharacterized protein n=1 Tax=Conidiobolus coronatus (strain ATCC 28846 / CBS 209.66 / NRRL 28638) TaxID=796925 RepID=A0A137PDV9_CONC2|nr:hypothetical protein CONCODRAFT_3861 [Conidiobolus coronatus NRRL 28638]|eukprot:KXN73194.1 hypothetical protein CONCODRAFT_3861 [Conidiobolus coronatus NRRL 28638]